MTSCSKDDGDIESVLICQSRQHSTDYHVIALYSDTANVIAFSSRGVLEAATIFNKSMSKSERIIKISHDHYDGGFEINRADLTLFRSHTVRETSKPFTISARDDCQIASLTDYQKARDAYKQKQDADKKDSENEKQDAIKKQKI